MHDKHSSKRLSGHVLFPFVKKNTVQDDTFQAFTNCSTLFDHTPVQYQGNLSMDVHLRANIT